MKISDLNVGDILVQCKGEPWTQGAYVLTGHPFPHAMLVSKVSAPNQVYIIEDSANGVTEHQFDEAGNGLTTFPLDHYEVWRPKCSEEVKQAAVTWARGRMGEGYGYEHLALILMLYRIEGSNSQPGWDDDPKYDNRKKVCSELIAMAYYRSGFDVVPGISDSNTMPWDLRNPATCAFQP